MHKTAAHGDRLAGLCALLALLAGIVFAVAHAVLTERYLARVSAERFHARELTLPLQEVPLGIASDGQTWIRHALALEEQAPGASWRLRHTTIDNAPEGREVHWNSAWAWWLGGLGKVRAHFTGESLPSATEKAARWAQLPLFLAVLVLACAWSARRWGAWAAVFVTLGVAGNRAFYEGFSPGYPDHHGLIDAALLGLVLGALGMDSCWGTSGSSNRASGAPPSRIHSAAKRAAILSGICGGLGLWISAVSTVIPIALLGIAAAISAAAGGDAEPEEVRARAKVWRLWGRVGAGVSLGFYLLEYAPYEFGWRLEVNHPLYALAWWGGSELVAHIVEWFGTDARDRKGGLAAFLGAMPDTLAVSGVLIAFAWGGTSFFIPEQPFMKRLYAHVDELKPFATRLAEQGLRPNRDLLAWQGMVVIGLLATWFARRRLRPGLLAPLIAVTLLTAAMTALGWKQNRWLLTAGASQVATVGVLAWAWSQAGARPRRRLGIAAAGLAVLAVCALGPTMLLRDRQKTEARRDVRRGEAMELLYRDLADRIRMDQAQGEVVLLASPNASTAIGYYGRFKTLGTFYWENFSGLETSARILLARTDDDAFQLIREHHVTHVVMLNAYSFVSEYHDALRPAWPVEETFAWRLLQGRAPAWLSPLPYLIPAQFSRWDLRVGIYAVDFGGADRSSASATKPTATVVTPAVLEELRTAARDGDKTAMAMLAWTLATNRNDALRDGREALRWAQSLSETQPESAVARGVLAAAYAELGLFPEANGAALQGLQLAEEQGNTRLATQLERLMRACQAKRPWRE